MTNDGAAAPASPELQFDKAEFAGGPATRTCQRCQRTITDEYFDAGGQPVCPECSEELSGARGGGFLRAFGYGAGAAVLGTIVWFAIIKLFDIELGLVAIAVGLGVGYAVRKGSRGRGGWKYQAMAMALTYGSITASYVPLVIKGFVEAGQKSQKEAAADKAGQVDTEQVAAPEKKLALAPSDLSGGKAALAVVFFLAIAFGLALVSPFLAGFQNIMGLIIIAIALYEAWKLNKRVIVTGPFRLAPPEPAAQPVAGAG
jgi:hypothetical protein